MPMHISRSKGRWGRALIAALALAPSLACAHTLGQTYLYLTVAEHELGVRIEATAADLNSALGLDLDTSGALEPEALEPHRERIARYLQDNVRLAPDGTPAELRFVAHSLRDLSEAQYVLSEFTIGPREAPPQFIDVEYAVMFEVDEKQTGVLVIENDWREGTFSNESSIALVFDASDRAKRLELADSSLLAGWWGMVMLGMHHILEGADHVMFLVALLLPAVARRDGPGPWEAVPTFGAAFWYVVKIVTVFTIAHSITLSLAALELLAMPSRLVESVIAASIALAAVEVFRPVFGRWVVLVVFAFGLFHGAGFAGVLLDMNIHSDYTVLTLFGFNLGVEIGQVLIVCLVFPVLFILRTWTVYLRLGMQSAASVLIAVSVYWFVERAFDVDLPAGEYAQKLFALMV